MTPLTYTEDQTSLKGTDLRTQHPIYRMFCELCIAGDFFGLVLFCFVSFCVCLYLFILFIFLTPCNLFSVQEAIFPCPLFAALSAGARALSFTPVQLLRFIFQPEDISQSALGWQVA